MPLGNGHCGMIIQFTLVTLFWGKGMRCVISCGFRGKGIVPGLVWEALREWNICEMFWNGCGNSPSRLS